METKKYQCTEWELSPVQTSLTKDKVDFFIQRSKAFEDFLDGLKLSYSEFELITHEYGVFIHVGFGIDDYSKYRTNLEVVTAYLKKHLPMRSYENVLEPRYSDSTEHYRLAFELDLDDFDGSYPSHDYFYMGVFR